MCIVIFINSICISFLKPKKVYGADIVIGGIALNTIMPYVIGAFATITGGAIAYDYYKNNEAVIDWKLEDLNNEIKDKTNKISEVVTDKYTSLTSVLKNNIDYISEKYGATIENDLTKGGWWEQPDVNIGDGYILHMPEGWIGENKNNVVTDYPWNIPHEILNNPQGYADEFFKEYNKLSAEEKEKLGGGGNNGNNFKNSNFWNKIKGYLAIGSLIGGTTASGVALYGSHFGAYQELEEQKPHLTDDEYQSRFNQLKNEVINEEEPKFIDDRMEEVVNSINDKQGLSLTYNDLSFVYPDNFTNLGTYSIYDNDLKSYVDKRYISDFIYDNTSTDYIGCNVYDKNNYHDYSKFSFSNLNNININKSFLVGQLYQGSLDKIDYYFYHNKTGMLAVKSFYPMIDIDKLAKIETFNNTEFYLYDEDKPDVLYKLDTHYFKDEDNIFNGYRRLLESMKLTKETPEIINDKIPTTFKINNKVSTVTPQQTRDISVADKLVETALKIQQKIPTDTLPTPDIINEFAFDEVTKTLTDTVEDIKTPIVEPDYIDVLNDTFTPDTKPDFIPEDNPSVTPDTPINNDDINFNGINNIDLKEIFPFCIPFDLVAILEFLNREPIAPHFVLPFVFEPLGVDYTFDIDFKDYEVLSRILRSFLIVIYVVALLLKTRDLIRG